MKSRILKALIGLIVLTLGAELLLRLLVPEDITLPLFDRSHQIFRAEHGREHPHSSLSSNLIRIAFIGDSVAMGAGLQRDQRLSSELEWLLNLNEGLTPVEVEVFAKPTSTYQQSQLFHSALDWGANIIVMVLSLNDTEDWSGDPRMVELRNGTRAWDPPAGIRWIMQHSMLIRLLVQRTVECQVLRDNREFYDYLYDPNYPGWQKLVAALHEYSALCAERKAKLMAILFPLMNQDFRRGHYPFENRHAQLRQACAADQIPFLDLLEGYRDSAPIRLANIPNVDDHPNEIAHRIAAENLFFFLLDQKAIDRAYWPRKIADRRMQALWRRHLEHAGMLDHDESEKPAD